MDSTVIQEIANQLGMAVDQAGQFITEHLPDFAALKAMQATVPMVLAWVFFAALAIAALACLAVCAHYRRKEINAKNEYTTNMDEKRSWSYSRTFKTDWCDYNAFYIFAVIGVIALVVLLFALFATAYFVPEVYGWSNYPEAMLIDMALKAV